MAIVLDIKNNQNGTHIGEVIETSTTQFVAQCLEPEDLNFPSMPPFGSWVKSFDEESGNKIFAVVTNVTTAPIDSVHKARALGLSLAELRQQQPQIFAMLKTEFQAAIVGFETPPDPQQNGFNPGEGKIYQYLPPALLKSIRGFIPVVLGKLSDSPNLPTSSASYYKSKTPPSNPSSPLALENPTVSATSNPMPWRPRVSGSFRPAVLLVYYLRTIMTPLSTS